MRDLRTGKLIQTGNIQNLIEFALLGELLVRMLDVSKPENIEHFLQMLLQFETKRPPSKIYTNFLLNTGGFAPDPTDPNNSLPVYSYVKFSPLTKKATQKKFVAVESRYNTNLQNPGKSWVIGYDPAFQGGKFYPIRERGAPKPGAVSTKKMNFSLFTAKNMYLFPASATAQSDIGFLIHVDALSPKGQIACKRNAVTNNRCNVSWSSTSEIPPAKINFAMPFDQLVKSELIRSCNDKYRSENTDILTAIKAESVTTCIKGLCVKFPNVSNRFSAQLLAQRIDQLLGYMPSIVLMPNPSNPGERKLDVEMLSYTYERMRTDFMTIAMRALTKGNSSFKFSEKQARLAKNLFHQYNLEYLSLEIFTPEAILTEIVTLFSSKRSNVGSILTVLFLLYDASYKSPHFQVMIVYTFLHYAFEHASLAGFSGSLSDDLDFPLSRFTAAFAKKIQKSNLYRQNIHFIQMQGMLKLAKHQAFTLTDENQSLLICKLNAFVDHSDQKSPFFKALISNPNYLALSDCILSCGWASELYLHREGSLINIWRADIDFLRRNPTLVQFGISLLDFACMLGDMIFLEKLVPVGNSHYLGALSPNQSLVGMRPIHYAVMTQMWHVADFVAREVGLLLDDWRLIQEILDVSSLTDLCRWLFVEKHEHLIESLKEFAHELGLSDADFTVPILSDPSLEQGDMDGETSGTESVLSASNLFLHDATFSQSAVFVHDLVSSSDDNDDDSDDDSAYEESLHLGASVSSPGGSVQADSRRRPLPSIFTSEFELQPRKSRRRSGDCDVVQSRRLLA